MGSRDKTSRWQRGQAIVWVAVMLPLFLATAGLAADAGRVFDARRRAQDIADAAATSGAMQIDVAALRRSSGATVVLDEVAARQAATDYLQSSGMGYAASISVESREVAVQVREDVATTFLRLVGITTVSVGAEGIAGPAHGIDRNTAPGTGD